MSQTRHPQGIPTGGQFAAGQRDEADSEILATDHPEKTSPQDRARLAAAGFSADDLVSADPQRRQAASAARGDLVLDGRLTAAAYELGSYGPVAPGDEHRTMTAPEHVWAADGQMAWADLEVAEQLAYFDGYAAAAHGVSASRERASALQRFDRPMRWTDMTLSDRGPSLPLGPASNRQRTARLVGFRRGVDVAYFEDAVAGGLYGPDTEVEVSGPDGVTRLGQVTVEPTDGRPVYVGRQRNGALVRFAADDFVRIA